ncbi:hypothetical protein ATE80_18010 [Streptomyces kanasensis]|uniref:Uncharacterized protein n=1 Tax=Streptomyces kanasensis TaxID=936756 RepID=A0A100Y4I6_9ACTN|nr:hypothetical protein ATE80_18010 [Streptomyces kanasensis]
MHRSCRAHRSYPEPRGRLEPRRPGPRSLPWRLAVRYPALFPVWCRGPYQVRRSPERQPRLLRRRLRRRPVRSRARQVPPGRLERPGQRV